MRAWPRILALSLGAVPVAMLLFMLATISYGSVDAVTQVGTRPVHAALPELAGTPPGNCGAGEAVDDDGDGHVNDGCPAVGAAEFAEMCARGTAIDEDADGHINDGCLVNPPDYGPMSVTRVANGVRALFGTDFSTIFSSGVGRYGLRPAMIGTLWVTLIAMALAVPASVCIAIFASEFPLGPLGRALRLVIGVFAGIPPIVYALMAVVLVAPFIAPKFAGGITFTDPQAVKFGVSPENWPPPGVPWNAGAFPWDPTGRNNSVLLAGIMLALLAIPFMTPLVDDAVRNVPRDPKEASMALGATRWHTLRRITLARALPGIIAAIGLGTLKVLGDVMIVLFVVGFDARMPSPLFDVLERTGPLTSTGSSLVGGFTSPEACRGQDCTVGYFTALFLLMVALVVVASTTLLERRFRKRMQL